ncbi:MAG: hypothetical protein ACRDUB_12495 [Mycobacterium sp.]
MHYFHRLDDTMYQATDHTGGAWNISEQHIAPSLGLLAHAVEVDRDARRSDGLRVAGPRRRLGPYRCPADRRRSP